MLKFWLTIIIEICLAVVLWQSTLSAVGNNLILDSLLATLSFVYLSTLVVAFIPGYIYLKSINKQDNFIFAVSSAIGWTFLAVILYIILAFLADIHFLQSKEAGFIFPILFGLIGFNLILFKSTSP